MSGPSFIRASGLQGSQEVHFPFFRCLEDRPHLAPWLCSPQEAAGAPHIHPAYRNGRQWTTFLHFSSPPLLPQWPTVREREEDFLSSRHSPRSEVCLSPGGVSSRVWSSSHGQQLLKADKCRDLGATDFL